MLGGPQHRTAEGMITEHSLVNQVLGQRCGLILGARDLLHDDASLTVHLVGIDPRPSDEVGQQIGGGGRCLGPGRDVECDQVVAGVGVEHSPDPLSRLVDVTVGRIGDAALEHKMLQKVGHPVLLRALGARAGVEGDQQGDRARTLDRDPVQWYPVGEHGGLDR